MTEPLEPIDRKDQLRRRAQAARQTQADPVTNSARALAQLARLPEFRQAHTVLWYVDSGPELRTRAGIEAALDRATGVVVPYCTVDENSDKALGLWRLAALEELVAGAWSILEPPPARWHEADRKVAARELDLAIVPGVAFDRQGARLGHGHGYYDRLLGQLRPNVPLIGLCFECQCFDRIPTAPHDIFMDAVVTEKTIYQVATSPRFRSEPETR